MVRLREHLDGAVLQGPAFACGTCDPDRYDRRFCALPETNKTKTNAYDAL